MKRYEVSNRSQHNKISNLTSPRTNQLSSPPELHRLVPSISDAQKYSIIKQQYKSLFNNRLQNNDIYTEQALIQTINKIDQRSQVLEQKVETMQNEEFDEIGKYLVSYSRLLEKEKLAKQAEIDKIRSVSTNHSDSSSQYALLQKQFEELKVENDQLKREQDELQRKVQIGNEAVEQLHSQAEIVKANVEREIEKIRQQQKLIADERDTIQSESKEKVNLSSLQSTMRSFRQENGSFSGRPAPTSN